MHHIFRFCRGGAALFMLILSCQLTEAAPLPVCGFRTNVAIMCTVGEQAADAFKTFGYDEATIADPYSLRIIHESGCGVIHADPKRPGHLLRFKGVRIAEPAGSNRALFLDMFFGGKEYAMWVDDNYLSGTCPRFVPNNQSGEQSSFITNTDQIRCGTNEAATEFVRNGVRFPDSVSDRDFEMAIESFRCSAQVGRPLPGPP